METFEIALANGGSFVVTLNKKGSATVTIKTPTEVNGRRILDTRVVKLTAIERKGLKAVL